ncbi:hypothetical protein PCE1_004181 [Barthelona sp. PCE]
MGLLSKGEPLTLEELDKKYSLMKEIATYQAIEALECSTLRNLDTFIFGDEVEYYIMALPEKDASLPPLLLLLSDEILNLLEHQQERRWDFCPEYAKFMIEGEPGVPFGFSIDDLAQMEFNLVHRRQYLHEILTANKEKFIERLNGHPDLDFDVDLHKYTFTPLTMPIFPTLGSKIPFTYPFFNAKGEGEPYSKSTRLSDRVISDHPRFYSLTRNVRQRRGGFHIERTSVNGNPVVGDAFGLGMGCCGLQVTFQFCDLEESLFIHDQLLALVPIFLALTAGSPFFLGKLVDSDVRVDNISEAVDDRTPTSRAPWSRYGINEAFLKCDGLQDVEFPYDTEVYETLRNAGCNTLLSKHIAFCLDKPVMTAYSTDFDESKSPEQLAASDESFKYLATFLSTTWQHVRWKPASHDSGCRVEFRPMEPQFTDFENSAFCIFINLLIRSILCYDISFLTKLSDIHSNIERAKNIDAVLNERFVFRSNPLKGGRCGRATNRVTAFGTALPIDIDICLAEIQSYKAERKLMLTPNGSEELLPMVGTVTPPPIAHLSETTKSYSGFIAKDGCPKLDEAVKSIDLLPLEIRGDDVHNVDTSLSSEEQIRTREMSISEIICGTDHFIGLSTIVRTFLSNFELEPETEERLELYIRFIERRACGVIPTPARFMRDFISKHADYSDEDNVITERIASDLMHKIYRIGFEDTNEMFGEMFE